MRWLVMLVVVAVACKKTVDDHVATVSSDAAVARADAAMSRFVAAIDAPAAIDAAASDAMTERDERTQRIRSYVELLAIDFWAYRLVVTFPGIPSTSTFVASSYDWHVVELMPEAALRDKVGAVLASSSHVPSTQADKAVHDYTAALAAALPKLLDLHAYFAKERFVDDEFDRARRELPDVEKLRDELARLRTPMRVSVLAAWRELSADVPNSPRAIVGVAWEKCVAFADHLMAGEKPDAIANAVSACRRSIPSVTALPPAAGAAFADQLRKAAIQMGNYTANSYMQRDLHTALAGLTDAYLALWPTLPTTPAERNAP